MHTLPVFGFHPLPPVICLPSKHPQAKETRDDSDPSTGRRTSVPCCPEFLSGFTGGGGTRTNSHLGAGNWGHLSSISCFLRIKGESFLACLALEEGSRRKLLGLVATAILWDFRSGQFDSIHFIAGIGCVQQY